MRKTYVATRTFEVVFTADEEIDDLSEVASEALDEGEKDFSEMDSDYREIDLVPEEWDDDSLVYGTHEGGMTLKEALSEELAPRYNRNLKQLREARSKFVANL